MSEKCGNCRFFLAGVSAAEAFKVAGGMCRRYAPTGPAMLPSGGTWQTFPPMGEWQWCGDYRPATDAAVSAGRIAA